MDGGAYGYGGGEKRSMQFAPDPAAKRPRTEVLSSKVVFLRNVPMDITEPELLGVCQLFGNVVATFVVRNKAQAFVEFDTEMAAAAFVAQFQIVPLTLRNQMVSAQLSQRQAVTRGDADKPVGSTVQNRVLLCTFTTISQLPLPYDVDTLSTLFSPFGHCQRMIKFGRGLKVLVQFATLQEAACAKEGLDGKALLDGTFIRVGFSNLPSIDIKQVSENGKDFDLMPAVPKRTLAVTTTSQMAMMNPMMAGQGYFAGIQPRDMYGQYQNPYAPPGAYPAVAPPQPVVLVNGVPENANVDVLFSLFGVYGDVQRVKILFQKRDSALIQFASEQQAQLAITHLDGVALMGSTLRVQMSNKTEVKLPRPGEDSHAELTKDFSSSPRHRFRQQNSRNMQNITSPSHVLHVSNLALEVSEDELRQLFEHNGSVVDVKFIMPEARTRKMALVTVENVDQGINCLIATDGFNLHNNTVRVNFAKPRQGAAVPGAGGGVGVGAGVAQPGQAPGVGVGVGVVQPGQPVAQAPAPQ